MMKDRWELIIAVFALIAVYLFSLWAINAADNQPLIVKEYSTDDPQRYGINAGKRVEVNIFEHENDDTGMVSAFFKGTDITVGQDTPGVIAVWGLDEGINAVSNSFTYWLNNGLLFWVNKSPDFGDQNYTIRVVEYNRRAEVLFPLAGLKAVKYDFLNFVLILPISDQPMSARIDTEVDPLPVFYLRKAGESLDNPDESRIIYKYAFLSDKASWVWVM